MSNIEEKEIWEFQRKSFVHWRKPFLPDDPPAFVSRDKQKLNDISSYKLAATFTWYQPKENLNQNTSEWNIQIADNITTDSQGWIYSDHFQSRKWSKNQFSSSHLCRKRCWRRLAKKQFVSKITKVGSSSALAHLSEENEREFEDKDRITLTPRGSQCEYIIHQVEVNQSGKWKPYQNGWFDQQMKSIKIKTPYDIKLSHLTKDKSLDTKKNGDGVWKWSEGWSCIDPDPQSNNNNKKGLSSNVDNTLYNNGLVKLQSLRYMNNNNNTKSNGSVNNNNNDEDNEYYDNDNAPDLMEEDIAPDLDENETQNGDGIASDETELIEFEYKTEELDENGKPIKKKKKKRIRLKKNAKKLFRKMKGNKKDKDKKTETRLKHSKSEGDILKLNNGGNRNKDNLLSTDEQIELHELFTNIERGWSYAIKFSRKDDQWSPQNNIISKCNFRRRTWVRCAIYDQTPIYHKNQYNQNKDDKSNGINEEKEDDEEEEVPMLTKSDSLAKSIARSKNKANDLIAMIDGVLSNDINTRSNSLASNTGTANNADKMSTIYKDNLNSTHSMNNNTLRVYDKYEKDKSIGSYIMGEALNALLWHVHLCSINNVVDRLPDDMDGDKKNKSKVNNTMKLYFMDNMRLRARKTNDFVLCLKGLSFNYESLINGEMKQYFDIKSMEEKYNISNLDSNSDDGIIEICKIIYDDLLSDILYQCSFHPSKELYSNQQRQQLMNKLTDIIVLYSTLKKTNSLSTMTEIVLLMSSLMKFIEKSKEEKRSNSGGSGDNKEDYDEDEKDDINPLWILDDLLNIGQQFTNVTQFELSCLFFPDMLTNLKHFLYILGKLDIDTLSRRERKLCTNAAQNILATLESYFQKLHDNVRPKTVVQLLQIFISLTDIFEKITRKSTKTTFKQIRAFLLEYHKLSIEKAYSNVLSQNKIQKLFVTTDINQLHIIINHELNIETENLEEINRSMSVLLSPRSKQAEQDMKEITFKLAKEYDDAKGINNSPQKPQTAEESMKQHQKVLLKYFRNKEVQDEWWEYIEDILNLIDNDYKISIALWKGKIFQNIPQVGIEHLATQCAKDFAGSFANNPHSLDIAYKLLLSGAHRLQDRLEAICVKINHMDNKRNNKSRINVGKIFSFVQVEIFERLSYWMDMSMNRVAVWIKRAAEKETWLPPSEQKNAKNRLMMTFKVKTVDKDDKKKDIDTDNDEDITWGTFITDSFSFINNELDAFFDHLISFPSEGMSMADVFFERLQFLVETVLHLTEMSMRDCTVLDNAEHDMKEMEEDRKEDTHQFKRKRKETRAHVRDEVHKMERGMDGKILNKQKRQKLIDDFSAQYVGQINESAIKGQDILNKFKQQITSNERLAGLKSIAEYVTIGINNENEARTLNGLPDLQRIEDEKFNDELKYICVKFSSLSRAIEIINDLSGYLLNKIQIIPAPQENTLKKKFEIHKQSLIKSAYQFIQNCKKEAKCAIERSVNRMVFQLLSVQNGAYFKLKMYKHGRIPSTTAIKNGLFQRIADYLNICSDYLREKDLQIIVKEIAIRFSRHMKEILIGYSIKPPRVFRKEQDTKFIVQDFEECKKLFGDFGLRELSIYYKNGAVPPASASAKTETNIDDDDDDDDNAPDLVEDEEKAEELKDKPTPNGDTKEKENEDEKEKETEKEEVVKKIKLPDLGDIEVDEEHPFFPYYQCVEYMRRDTVTLMQRHMIVMAKRNEQQKNQLYEQKQKESKNKGPLGMQRNIRNGKKNKGKGKNNKKNNLSSLAAVSGNPSIRARAIMDKAMIRKIYDDPLLHVLAHRADDEEASSYVENFVQYRNNNKPLLIDLSNISNTLRIIVHEGKDLPALDFTGKSDPFVKITVMPFKLKKETRVVRQTLNPKWDQELDFKMSKDDQNNNNNTKKKNNNIKLRHIMIEFDCWDWDTIGSDDHIGKHTERLEYGQDNVIEKWVTLYNNDDQSQGKLLITIECENLWTE